MTLSPPVDAAELARELRVHQAELETQNEELRRAQLELAAARDRYRHLFEVAPVGYLSLDDGGRIAELNLTGATLLGQPREDLLGRPFSACLHRRDRRRWRSHLSALVPGGAVGRLEAMLAIEEPAPKAVQLDTLRLAQPGSEAAMRVTLTDISERRDAETDRRIAAQLIDAREAERLRVARTLHEDLGQRLSAIKIGLSLLPHGTMGADPDAGRAQAQTLQFELDESIAVVRRMANELHPAMLDDLGLNAAMQWLARDAGPRLGLGVQLHAAPRDPPLEPRTVIGVYRLMEGLLEEVARDTSGAQVLIDLREQGEALRVDMTVRPGGWPLAARSHGAPRPRPARLGRAAATIAIRPALQAELLSLGGRFLEAQAAAQAAPGTYCLQVLIPLRAPRSRTRALERVR